MVLLCAVVLALAKYWMVGDLRRHRRTLNKTLTGLLREQRSRQELHGSNFQSEIEHTAKKTHLDRDVHSLDTACGACFGHPCTAGPVGWPTRQQ